MVGIVANGITIIIAEIFTRKTVKRIFKQFQLAVKSFKVFLSCKRRISRWTIRICRHIRRNTAGILCNVEHRSEGVCGGNALVLEVFLGFVAVRIFRRIGFFYNVVQAITIVPALNMLTYGFESIPIGLAQLGNLVVVKIIFIRTFGGLQPCRGNIFKHSTLAVMQNELTVFIRCVDNARLYFIKYLIKMIIRRKGTFI